MSIIKMESDLQSLRVLLAKVMRNFPQVNSKMQDSTFHICLKSSYSMKKSRKAIKILTKHLLLSLSRDCSVRLAARSSTIE